MKGSKGKKIVIILAAIVVAAIAAVIVFSSLKSSSSANTFVDSGYILVSNPETDEKTVQFKSGAEWKYGTDSTIVFNDIQNNKTSVDEESFVHYTSGTLQSLSNGVLVDLDELDDNQFTEHYALSNKIFLTPSGDGYQMTNSTVEHSVSDAIWKLNESKYMLISDTISLHFADDDVRDVSGFVELSYIDNGVIQFQTEDNYWQTVSSDCYGTLSNGIIVDFSYKSIENKDGEVLMDFNKIVVDSEDNVEVQPVSESISELTEEVVPHFNVTAEDGLDGSSGSSGGSGGSGSNGSAGGSQGQGTDGVDGDQIKKAEDGEDGDDGDSQSVEGKVLHFPVFNLEIPEGSSEVAWEIGSTYCKGNIMVTDSKGMLVSQTEDGKGGRIYLIDVESSQEIDSIDTDFSGVLATGYPFEFTDLEPERAYRLVVDAPIRTSQDSDAYVRNFITKEFYTDSTGLYFTAEDFETTDDGKAAVSIKLITEEYSNAKSVSYQKFDTLEEALNVTERSAGWIQVENFEPHVAKEYTVVSYNELEPNQTFYIRGRAVVDENNQEVVYLTDQILTVTTLKQRATIGSPLVASNRYSWGFDITAGTVSDPNGGIQKYTYEFYYESDVENGKLKSNAVAQKSVVVYSTDSVTVPLDATTVESGVTGLKPETSYVVRCVAEFNDNEKTYDVISGFSNACQVTGSQTPTVYFTNAGSQSSGSGTSATTKSTNYDAIAGTVHVNPSNSGARLVLTGLTADDVNTYHPYAIIRASGYYYVKYPIYPDTASESELPTDGKYLKASDNHGMIEIQIPDTALSGDQGGVDGLKGGIGYSVIIVGNLTEDGSTYTNQNITVGTCMVSTPKMQGVKVEWGELNPSSSENPKTQDANFTFTIDNAEPTEESATTFERMMQTLDRIEMKLYSGTPESETKTQVGYTVIISKDENPQDPDPSDNTKYYSYKSFVEDESINSLAKAVVDGIHITDAHFGITQTTLTNNIYIELTLAEDYTVYEDRRTNQTDCVSDPDSFEEPELAYVYENIYSLSNQTCEITLGNIPDPLPKYDVEENSFVVDAEGEDIHWYDTDGDGNISDKAVMQANYENSCKIAKTITYYVFDAPDFYKVYDKNTYHVSSAFTHDSESGLAPIEVLTAVTAVQDINEKEVGNWLGKVTIDIPKDGTMPEITFIPQTAENYIHSVIDDDDEAEEMIDAYYSTGKFNGSYYLFYNQGSNEKVRGHQFVFAWTLTYLRNDAEPEKTEFYPFDLDEYTSRYDTSQGGNPTLYGANGYYSIPHSAPQDMPFKMADVTSVPWESAYTYSADLSSVSGTVTWRAGAYDPDGVIASKDSNDSSLAIVYFRNSGSNASITTARMRIGSKADGYEGINLSYLISATRTDYNVEIDVSGCSAGTTYTMALGTQRYSDVYTTAGRENLTEPYKHRLFLDDSTSYISGSEDGIYTFKASSDANSKDKYSTAFANYIETKTDLDTVESNNTTWVRSADTMQIIIDGDFTEEYPAGSGQYIDKRLSSFNVTVKGNAEDVKLIDGVRIVFEAEDGTKVTLDKYLDVALDVPNAIVISGNEAEISFEISLSRDLGNKLYDVTNKENVKVTASALYEGDEIGYGYVAGNSNNTYAYTRYQLAFSTSNNLYVSSRRSWSFDNRCQLTFPELDETTYRMGSFFNIYNFSTVKNSKGNIIDYAVNIDSTRIWEWADYTTSARVGLNGNFGTATVVSVPRVLEEARMVVTYNKWIKNDSDQRVLDTTESCEKQEQATITVPEPLKDIEYKNIERHVNALKIEYNTSAADPVIYYTVQKSQEKAEISEDNLKWQTHDATNHKWTELSLTPAQVVNKITQEVSGTSSEVALQNALAAINDNGVLLSSYSSSTGYGTFSVDDLEASTEENKRTYRIKAWYWSYNEQTGKGQFVRYKDLSDNDNYIQAETLNVPAVTLTDSFIDTTYDIKSLRLKTTPSKATKYYYTLELYKHNGTTDEFVTYLYAGKSVSTEIIDVGKTLTNGQSDFAYITTLANISHNGDNIIFDTTGCERLYLDYNATIENGNYYTVRVRMYDLGSGPAWGYDPLETDLLKDNEDKAGDSEEVKAQKASLRACYIKTIETPYVNSELSVTGEVEIVTEGNKTYPRAKFSPMFVANSNSYRKGMYTFVVVRKTTDDDNNTIYKNVTRFVYVNTTGGTSYYPAKGGLFSLDLSQDIYLNLDGDNFEVKTGDTFTLYPFVVQDIPATTYGYLDVDSATHSELSNIDMTDYILSDRATLSYAANTSTSDTLTAAQVSALASYSEISKTTLVKQPDSSYLSTNSGISKNAIDNPFILTYEGGQANAGTISVSPLYDSNKVPRQANISMMNPVGFTSIKTVHVSIQATYTYTDTETSTTKTDNVLWSDEDNEFQDHATGASGNYYYVATPEFNVDETLPNFTWTKYIVTLQYEAFNPQTSQYEYITVKAAAGDNTASVSSDGKTYSKTIIFKK